MITVRGSRELDISGKSTASQKVRNIKIIIKKLRGETEGIY